MLNILCLFIHQKKKKKKIPHLKNGVKKHSFDSKHVILFTFSHNIEHFVLPTIEFPHKEKSMSKKLQVNHRMIMIEFIKHS